MLKKLEVAEIVDKYCPTEVEVKHGTVVSVLVLNRLTAPRPLYHIARWMAFTILPLVLGISARKFNDDRLGRTLDAIEPHLREIWIEIVIRALEQYDIDPSVIPSTGPGHRFYDLTAFVMMGSYEGSELVDVEGGFPRFAHNTPMNKRKLKLAANVTQDGGILFDWAAICGRESDTATAEGNVPTELAQQLLQVLGR